MVPTGPWGHAVLELEKLTAGYGETVVLRDVTISVPDSKVVALLGPNGAGKTTTLRTASGLIKPTEGRVLFDGEDVTGKKPYTLAASRALPPAGRARDLPVPDRQREHSLAVTQREGAGKPPHCRGPVPGAGDTPRTAGREPQRR